MQRAMTGRVIHPSSTDPPPLRVHNITSNGATNDSSDRPMEHHDEPKATRKSQPKDNHP